MAISSAGQGDLTGSCLVAGPEPGTAFSDAAETAAAAPRQNRAATPAIARMYDWFLGGDNNSAVDREAAGKVLDRYPGARLAARANRAFLRWAVGHLAGTRGIRQFLDVGAGLPARPNVHELAQRAIEHVLQRHEGGGRPRGPEQAARTQHQPGPRHDTLPDEGPTRE